jgi:hypothetical protein
MLWENVMAKGQQRSGREPKKPKKDKAKVEASVSPNLWKTLEMQAGDRAGKRR